MMKILKKVLLAILGVLILGVFAAFLYLQYLKPSYEGEIKLKNLSQTTEVYFDEFAVPHIFAQTQEDAYIALGYLHAQERLWQMELIRRIAPGRLSEILGEDLLKTDMFFSGLGIEEASEQAISNLDKNSPAYILSLKYLDGINQFIEHGKTPLEFTLLGVEKEKYSLKDIYNVIGYMAFNFAVAHKTDPLLTEVKEKLGEAYLDELLSSSKQNLTLNQTEVNPIKAELSLAVYTIMKHLPIPPFIGSNAWVIGPEKTKNGHVIFENDPHIGYSQPSVWYQSHIKTPDYEMYGFNIALMPFPLLGHNRQYAYGLTMFANDDLNFYVEENNPNNPLEYKTDQGFDTYQITKKTIEVKDAQDTTITVRESQHGPIMNDLIEHLDDSRPIAMHWMYTQLNNEILEVNHGISHSSSLQDFIDSAQKLHAPGLNMMYGDADGNIAWLASAKLYELREGLSTKTFLNGSSGTDEILEILPFEENPKAINPDHHYVYSANHQPDSVRGKLYPGYYQPEDRSKRIVELLEAKDNFTKEDVAEMAYDVKSSKAPEIIKDFIQHLNQESLTETENKALSIMSSWDGNYFKDAVAPTIYNRVLYQFLVSTYKDEMGEAFPLFINTQLQDQALQAQINHKSSVWWDDVTTTDLSETRPYIIQKSFKKAVQFLNTQLGNNIEDWTWKRVISVEHEHAFGRTEGLLRRIFNVGPFETIGGNEVLNNQIFNLDSTGIYKIRSGPSTRRIIDFSDIENGLSILPTGQSGHLLGDHYQDQSQMYLDGDYITMYLNTEKIKSFETKLIFEKKE